MQRKPLILLLAAFVISARMWADYRDYRGFRHFWR
jgi:hypothetical protein